MLPLVTGENEDELDHFQMWFICIASDVLNKINHTLPVPLSP